MLNAARLRVLKAREDHVGSVLDEAKKRLAEATKDNAKYTGLLQQLIAQGLLQVFKYFVSNVSYVALKSKKIIVSYELLYILSQLLELNVLIRCRQADLPYVESVVAPAISHYKERTGKDCNVKVDNESFLSAHV